MSAEDYTGHDLIADEFNFEIGIPPSQEITFAHLSRPALLWLADTPVIVKPEENSLVPQLQSYKLCNFKGIIELLHRHDFGQDAVMEYFDTVHKVDYHYLAERAEPPRGVIYLPSDHTTTLGTEASPRMLFGVSVSRDHAAVSLDDRGITFTDLMSTNGTRLQLSELDANRVVEMPQTGLINDDLKNDVYMAYRELFPKGGHLEVNQEGLDVSVSDVLVLPGGDEAETVIELEVSQAEGYQSLGGDSYTRSKKFFIERLAEGIKFFAIRDYSVKESFPDVERTIPRESQVTPEQAVSLLGLAKELEAYSGSAGG